jgi:hypothetical protein
VRPVAEDSATPIREQKIRVFRPRQPSRTAGRPARLASVVGRARAVWKLARFLLTSVVADCLGICEKPDPVLER